MLLIILIFETFGRSFIFLLIKHLICYLFLFDFSVDRPMMVIFIVLMIVTFNFNVVEIDLPWRFYENSYFFCCV